jgi:hypothetical protein
MTREGFTAFQKQFFHFAMLMLACELQVMGGEAIGSHVSKDDLAFNILGVRDMRRAMWMLCCKHLGKQVVFEPGKGWSAS